MIRRCRQQSGRQRRRGRHGDSDSLAGFVYVDANNDGIKQPGEMGLVGVTVTLTGTDILGRPVTATTTTFADGSYSFSDLVPGNYTVTRLSRRTT